MPPPPTGYPRCRILLGRIRVYLPRLLCLFLQFHIFSYGRRTINRPLLHYLLLLYHNIFLLSSILYDFFGIIFIFFSASIARSTDVPLRVSTAPSLRAALWFSRLRRLNSCFEQKGNFLTSLSPNYSTYPRYSLLSSSLSQVCSF